MLPILANLAKLFRKRKSRKRVPLEIEFLEDRWVPSATQPLVTSVLASSGPTSGGNTVTINGSDLSGATAVNFGSSVVTTFTSDTASQIVLTAPAGAAGSVDVTVTNGDGTSATSAADTYTFVPPLTPTAQLSSLQGDVTASDGTPITGVLITLTGTTTSGTSVNLTTQTDGNGNYVFSQLQPGTYSVARGSTGFYLGGAVTLGDLGGSSSSLSIGDIALQSGQVAAGYDFQVGYVTLAAISLYDYLSITPNNLFSSLIPSGSGSSVADGSSNPSSGQSFGSGTAVNSNAIAGSVQNQSTTNGIAGVQVTLSGVDYTGTLVAPMVAATNSSGDYQFSDLNPGTYTVQVSVPSGDQAVSATPGADGGFAQFNTEIYDITISSTSTGATLSGYNFDVTPQTSTSGAASGPTITAGLVDTTGTFTADPAIQGTVSPGSDGAAVTTLLVGVNGAASFNASSSLVNGSFYLNEATLAQIAGTGTALPDGTYTISFEAMDAAGNVTTFSLPQFTLQTTPPATPTLAVQTSSGSVLNTSSTSLGTLVQATGGWVITNPNSVNPATSPQTITLTGTTSPNATVSLFAGSSTSPLTATADSSGNFTFTPTLSQAVTDFTVEATNEAGVSSFFTMFVNLSQPLTTTSYTSGSTPDPLATSVSAGTTSSVVNLADGFNDPNASNVVVELNTSAGPVYVELFAGATPQSVDNFLAYIDSNSYNEAVFSRLVSNFVLQGGEFQLQNSPTGLASITPLSTINGEVGINSNPSASNADIAGTLAFALPGGSSSAGYNDNGGSDQFFFNLTNDSSSGSGNNLDADFAVFGKVLSGTDMRVLNSLATTPVQNESAATAAVTTLTAAITDTTSSTDTITVASTSGNGANIVVNSTIEIDGEQMLVTAISGDTLTVTRASNSTTEAAHADGATVSVVYADLSSIPLNNYTGTNFPTDASASNFETVDLATVLSQSDQLTYSVTVNDPSGILSGDTANSASSFVPLTAANGTLSANDTLSLNYNTGVAGTATLDVTATDLAGNSVTQTFTVTLGATSTTTTTSSTTATFSESNQSVTLTANVASTAGTINEGTVTFTVEDASNNQVGTSVTSSTVAGGTATASFTLPANTAPGTYTVNAVYNDTANGFQTSNGSNTLTVVQAGTSTTVDAATATFGTSDQSVPLSATVTSAAGTVNEGTVTFSVVDSNNNPVGTSVTSSTVSGGTATANFTLPANTPAGTYTVTAVYNGDSNLLTSNETNSLTVSQADTATAVDAATATFGTSDQSVPLTATVTSAAGTVNEGTITFSVVDSNNNPVGTSVTSSTVSGGTAAANFTLPANTPAGTYTVTAVYNGDGNLLTSNETNTLTVSQASSSIAVTPATTSFSSDSQSVTLSAQITSSGGPVNEGTVTFTVYSSSTLFNAGTQVGTPTTSTTVSGGSASVNYTLPAGLASGTYTIVAVIGSANDYEGNSIDGVLTVTSPT